MLQSLIRRAGPLVAIHYNKSADDVLEKRIIIFTNLSLKKLSPLMRFDNMIILNAFHVSFFDDQQYKEYF